MRRIRRHLLAVAATTCVFALTAPLTSASAEVWQLGPPADIPVVTAAAGPMVCGDATPVGNGTGGGTITQSCGVATTTVIDAAVGEETWVVGPSIVGSTVAEPITVSGGAVAAP